MKETKFTKCRDFASRSKPFKVSYHGDSTILVDASGRWITGQVPRNEAEKIAAALTKATQ